MRLAKNAYKKSLKSKAVEERINKARTKEAESSLNQVCPKGQIQLLYIFSVCISNWICENLR